MSSVADLIQGLYNCGSLERGHTYLKEHASEVTSEFVEALSDSAMNLLSEDQSDPDLAKAFAELAIVAAIHLGDEHAKGMAFYCKGSILARLEGYREALNLLGDAQAYLRAAGSAPQLANCLFDAALCHDKLGEYASALRVLKEVLQYQHDEKNRADTLAFMLVLTNRKGDDAREFLEQVLVAGPKRNFLVRLASVEERPRIAEALLSQLPGQPIRELFRKSIPTFLEDSGCHFFLAVDAANPTGERPAFGILKHYREPFNEWDLLGLEAVCFPDTDTNAHLDVIERLRQIAQELNIQALCISESGLGQPATFKALLASLGLQSVPSVLMQGAQPGLYSAFADLPTTRAFLAPCIAICARPERLDFAGAVEI